MACVLEQAREAFAYEHSVLGDHEPHGSVASIRVPLPRGLAISSVPPCGGHAILEAGETGASACDGAADAVVEDAESSVPFFCTARSRGGAAQARQLVWERVFVGGSLLAGAAVLVVAMTNFALVDSVDNGASAGALEALNLLVGNAWVALNAGPGC